MGKINDIIFDLKELEKTAINHIGYATTQTHDEDDTKTVHKSYLFDCISEFIEYIKDVDGSFAGNHPSDADGKTDAKRKSVWQECDFVMSQDLIDAIAKEAAQAATKTVVELMTISSKDNPNVCEAATKAATDAILTYLMGISHGNNVKESGLLDKINPDKKEKASDIEYFHVIPDKLDLNDDHICKLLPYLLTAYVCSVNRNSVFLRGKAARRYIYGNPDIGDEYDLPRVARLRSQDQGLIKCFSLNGIAFVQLKARKKRPEPYIVNRLKPYYDAVFVRHVFELFAAITCDESKCGNEIIQNVVNKIDLKSCYFLFLSYTCPDELYKLSDESVTSCWNDSEYNKRLFQAFRSHYECGYSF